MIWLDFFLIFFPHPLTPVELQARFYYEYITINTPSGTYDRYCSLCQTIWKRTSSEGLLQYHWPRAR